MYKSVLTLFILMSILLLSCKQKVVKDIPKAKRTIDSLYDITIWQTPDNRLAALNEVRKIAGQHHLGAVKLRAFCQSAITYSLSKQDLPMAKKMMDSARQYMNSEGNKEWVHTYNLYLSMIYKLNDTAVVLMEQVLPHLDKLTRQDRLLTLGNYALLQLMRSNHKIAITYNLRYLEENRNQKGMRYLADELMTLNNLYFCLREIGDTAKGFTYLKEAEQLIIDSLPDVNNAGIIYINLGEYYLSKHNTDSARYYFNIYKKIAEGDYTYSQTFMPYLFLAATDFTEKQYARANSLIDTAASLLENDQKKNVHVIDHYFLKEYYDYYYRIKKANNKVQEALTALEQKAAQDSIMFNRQKNDQILQYERLITSAKAEKEIADKEQKIIEQRMLSFALLVLLLLVALVAAILVLSWKRKKEQETLRLNLFEKETKIKEVQLSLQAESSERQRIARELHDELGSTLTRIKMSAHLIRKETMPHPSKAVDILEDNCGTLLKQANEIVWSLNDSNDNLKSLIAYINRFCTDFLTAAKITYVYSCNEFDNRPIEGFKRRAIYHTVKEIINNAVKHSACSEIVLSIEVKELELSLSIKDNGRGISITEDHPTGNGLLNIAQNISRLNGTLERQTEQGTSYYITIPLSRE